MGELGDALSTRTRDRLLACDFEGVNLSRAGELCLGQFATASRVVLIDFVALRHDALQTSWQGITLAQILSSPRVCKIIFDPRCDSDALFHQYGVEMRNVICLQLMDIAQRRKSGKDVTYCPGLASILRNNNKLQSVDSERIGELKEQGRLLFQKNPEIWKLRPLPELLLEYSEADATTLLPLYHHYLPQ